MGSLLANNLGKTYPNQVVTMLLAHSMEYSDRFMSLSGFEIEVLYALKI